MPDRLDRRDFLRTAAAAAAASSLPLVEGKPAPDSETLVTTLYKSLNEEQKSKICFGFDDPLRLKVDANWRITPHKIVEVFNRDQQAMVEEIFTGLHNPEFASSVIRHMEEDYGGVGNYSVALFGEPAKGRKFEFVLTGRHCTARCDGDSVEGAAFGGPIMYGHQSGPKDMEAPDHGQNVYWFQAKRANEVFQALNGKQREAALLSRAPRAEAQNKTVALRTKEEGFAGLPVADMTRDQRALVEKVMGDLLLPFRKKDTAEAMKYIGASGGVESMHLSFYKNMDIGNDGVWDVWQLESPNMVWLFRGYPQSHTWVNLRGAAQGIRGFHQIGYRISGSGRALARV
ncbi:MAG: DUF3500 domain-containing protein [Bryobacteraceae bacterium]